MDDAAARASHAAVMQTVMSMQAEPAIDLGSLQLPTGTSVRYVDADEEDPNSIRVPAWSLRAMALKKKRMTAEMTGSVVKKLGSQGGKLVDKMVMRRSTAQQDEILAHALLLHARGVAAAGGPVLPGSGPGSDGGSVRNSQAGNVVGAAAGRPSGLGPLPGAVNGA